MKAVLLQQSGKPEITTVADPICPPGGVVVKITACGICSADAKMAAKGHPALVYPRIPGHEIAGKVMESRSARFRVGDRVQVAPGMRCGRCEACTAGADNQCPDREIFGFTVDGGFAEHIAVPLDGPVRGAVWSIPENVPDAEATLAEPLACCLNAQEKAGVARTGRMLIIGGGPLGMLHAIMGKHRGIRQVWVSDPLPHRREAALCNGADHVVDPEREPLGERIMEQTKGRGVDAVMLSTAAVPLDDTLLGLLAPGGCVSLFSGIAPEHAGIRLDMNRIHYREIRMAGAYGCTADQNRRALEIIASCSHPLGELITHRTTLTHIESGLAHTRARAGMKSIVEVYNG